MIDRSAPNFTVTALAGFPLVRPGDNLALMIADAVRCSGDLLQAGDVIVIAQKVVSKAEGRHIELKGVVPSDRSRRLAAELGKDPRLVEVVLSESVKIVRASGGMLITENHLGLVMANAGVDLSNVEQPEGHDVALLLPIDPDASACRIREGILSVTGVPVGVLINDSAGRAWRLGVTSIAIGGCGVQALADLRGSPDLFASPLHRTRVALADMIACAASLVMGEADEGLPVVRVRGLHLSPGQFRARDLVRPEQDDLFR